MHAQNAPRTDVKGPSLLRELMVEVFLARGAEHHEDLQEAADEFQELFAQFGILTEANEALILRKVAELERRAGRSRLRLVDNGAEGGAEGEADG